MHRRRTNRRYRYPAILLVASLLPTMGLAQQGSAAPVPPGTPDRAATDAARLEARLTQVLSALDGMQQQLNASQQEIENLRSELRQMHAALDARTGNASPSGDQSASAANQVSSSLANSVAELREQQEVLQAEVKQHDQTKLESISKYPIRISGMLLFTSFLNFGTVDNIDDPVLAMPRDPAQPNGSLAATLRQSILGLDANGPEVWGARSSANLSVDFFGGSSYADYTTTSGLLRLRTASLNLDWQNHSVAAALDEPMISPLEPTSYVGVGEPALAWSGNLWTWTPQLEIKNRTALGSGKFGYDFAFMDPAAPGPPLSTGQRQPNAAERSRQPGYETRVSYAVNMGDRPLEIGAGGFYSRQAYDRLHDVDAWAGTAYWKLGMSQHMELSGEVYRGRAIGGLGGGAFKDYVSDSYSPALRGLDAEGGWAQLKFRLPASLEANLAFGQDSAFANELRFFGIPEPQSAYANLARNRTALGNVVFRPKTYLLFSAEYRRIQSWPVNGGANTAPALGLAAGYLF